MLAGTCGQQFVWFLKIMYVLHKICHRPEIDCPRKIPCLLIARQNSANLRSPSLSSFGPDRFLSVSLSESGLAGRLNQRRELGCFVKSELQGGHKLRYNFPCGQFQVNSEIRCCEKFPADSATAIMRKLQDIKLSQQMDLPPSWFVWCQQNWLSRDTLCFVGNTLRPWILVDAEFVQISNASAISSRSLHIQKKLDLEFRKDYIMETNGFQFEYQKEWRLTYSASNWFFWAKNDQNSTGVIPF